jgi:hypothetical protein
MRSRPAVNYFSFFCWLQIEASKKKSGSQLLEDGTVTAPLPFALWCEPSRGSVQVGVLDTAGAAIC